jgi:hypothetical protein
LHKPAAVLAEDATIQYLDDLKGDLCGDGTPLEQPGQFCTLLRLLYGVGPTLSFAIDTTGSMGPVITGVRSDAISIVNARRGTLNEPVLYVLAPFNDPNAPQAQSFTDADAFIAAIQALTADGGGDCPELAMHGLEEALALTSEGGQIFLWTDAGAKDALLATEVSRLAQEKSIQIHVFQFPSECSTSAGFDAVTKNSGGHLFINLSPGDAGATARLATELVQEDIIHIFQVNFPSIVPSTKRVTGRTISFDIPVDSTMEFLACSISGDGITLTINRPDGSTVSSTDAGVTIVDPATGIFETVQKPNVGVWTVTVNGDSAFSLSAFGKSTLQFSTFDFVDFGGGHHDGLFKVQSAPAPGAVAISHAIMHGDFSDASFEFRSLLGQSFATLDMGPGSGTNDFETPRNHFYGSGKIPSEAFNVYAIGKDSTGASYQRMLPGILNLPSSNSTAGNTTLPINSTSSTSSPRYVNSTMSATGVYTIPTSTSSVGKVCPTCQPKPYSAAATTLSR